MPSGTGLTMDQSAKTTLHELAKIRLYGTSIDGFRFRYTSGPYKGAVYEMSDTVKYMLYGFKHWAVVHGGCVVNDKAIWHDGFIIPRLTEQFCEFIKTEYKAKGLKIFLAEVQWFGICDDTTKLSKKEANFLGSKGFLWSGSVEQETIERPTISVKTLDFDKQVMPTIGLAQYDKMDERMAKDFETVFLNDDPPIGF